MPSYPGTAGVFVPAPSNLSPIQLQKGESVYVFGQLAAGATQLPVQDLNVTFEAAPGGASVASIAVNCQVQGGDPQPEIAVEMHTNGVPGAGESFAIQEAETDADGFYVTPTNPANTVSAFNANNVARTDLAPIGGKFIRVLRTKGANAVGATVKITRVA